MVTISAVTNVTQTTATLNFAGRAADGAIEVQLAPRPDFEFCVAPPFVVNLADNVPVVALNGDETYYARARDRRASGAIGEWQTPPLAFRTAALPARNTAPAAVMIEPAIIVLPQPGVVLTSTATIAGYPPSNMLRPSLVAWRASDDQQDSRFFRARLSGEPWDVLALLNTNLPEAASIAITGYANEADWNAGNANGVQLAFQSFRASANLPGRRGYHGIVRLAAPSTYRFLDIRLRGAVTGGVTHVEHCVIGLNRMTKNHSVEKTETPSPMTTIERFRSGIYDQVRGLPMRKVEFDLAMLREAAYEINYGDLWEVENEFALVIPNSKPGPFLHDRMLLGELSGGRIVNPSSPFYSRTFTINSII